MNNTEIYLCSVPFDNEYNHTLYFKNLNEQLEYFKTYSSINFTDFSYQRKDNIVRINALYDDIQFNNYCFYRNTKYSSKWYFAFIKEMRYINDNVTELLIETDVIQTWIHTYKLGECFVEREHVIDDTTGLHTLPEGLETGEFICNKLVRDENLREYCYVILVTEWYTSDNKPLLTNFGGVPSAGGAYVCEDLSILATITNGYDQKGKGDAIIGVYMLPKKFLEEENTDGALTYTGRNNPITYEVEINKQTSIDGYTPKNNKLLCYPYNYINLSNNAGSSNIIQYEHFSTENCKFEVVGIPSIGGSIKCVPLKYKGLERIQEEGIVAGKFPTLSWSSDLYTNWCTQNAVNNGIGMVTSGLSVIGGLGMMFANPLAGAGMMYGGVMGITNNLAQRHQMSFTPNSAKGNVNAGDINSAYKMNTFYFYQMSIKKEYAKVIDDYFNMYGYKVNAVKVPNKNHRSNHWYTKTIEANITGNLPIKDREKIINIYNKGITFWKNPATFRDYSQANNIIE